MTRKTAFAGFSYLAGLLFGSFFVLKLSLAAGITLLTAGIGIMVLIRPDKKSRLFRAAVFAICCSGGILLYSIFDIAARLPVQKYDGAAFSGSCQVTEARYFSVGGAEYIVKINLNEKKTVKAALYSYSESALVRGDEITVKGTLRAPDSNGFFDKLSYYSSRGVFLQLSDAEITAVNADGNSFYDMINAFRTKIIQLIRRTVGGDHGEMLIGMLFGSSFWSIGTAAENALRRAGIMHVCTVSGMHMSIAAGISAAAVKAGRGSNRAEFAAVCISTLLFGAVSGMTVSAVRSIIMILLVYSSALAGRRNDPLTSLAIAIILLTALSPFCVRNTSFLLSVSGVFGTSVAAPAVIRAIEKSLPENGEKDRKAGILLSSAVTSLCASAAVFPIAALSFDEISVVSPLSNLILSPLCTVSVMISLIAAAIGVIPFLTPVSSGMLYIAGLICRPVIALSKTASGFPAAAIPTGLEMTLPAVIIFTVTAAASIIFLRNKLFRSVAASSAVLLCSAAISIYWLTPDTAVKMTVITEGSGCVIVISGGGSAEIYDFAGTNRCANEAVSYIRRNGLGKVSAAVLFSGDKTAELYRDNFPESEIIAENNNSGLTYSPKDTIINIGAHKALPSEDYAVIQAENTEIIVISRKSEPPDRHYDLVVYNCRAAVSARADMYAVTRSSFGGNIPAGVPCVQCETAEYIIADGEIYPKEEIKWLR